jgi:subtilisin-like proprotein convertase family protein
MPIKSILIIIFLLISNVLVKAQNCQTIKADIFSNIAANDSGIIEICAFTSVNFSAKGVYTQNNLSYMQSDSTSIFTWYNDQTTPQIKNTVSFFFTESGTHKITLTIKDTKGCIGMATRLIRVSAEPEYRTNRPTLINLGDSVILNANVNNLDTVNELSVFDRKITTNLNSNNENKFIPDEPTSMLETSIHVFDYPIGAKVTDVTNFFVGINIEHSFARDLNIKITCPNGQNVNLLKFSAVTRNKNKIFLGKPNNQDANFDQLNNPIFNPKGIGADYVWKTNAQYTFVNRFTLAGSYILPAGNYLPSEPFTQLTGCPLNGEWKISYNDNFENDNGWIFGWNLGFETLQKDSFSNKITQFKWLNDLGVSKNYGDSILVKPLSLMDSLFRFEVKDNLGCTYRNAYKIKILPKDYGELTGQIYTTTKSNCQKDNTSQNVFGKAIKIYNATDTFYTTTQSNGSFNIPIKEGNYSIITDSIPNFKRCTDSIVQVKIVKKETSTATFGFQPKAVIKDWAIKIGAYGPIRPGFQAHLYVIVKNKGTYTSYSPFSVILDSIFTPLTNSGNWSPLNKTIQWGGVSLLPNESQTFDITAVVSRFVAINTPVNCYARINPEDIETDTLDNNAEFTDRVRGSLDPNDKLVSPKGNVPYGTTQLDYTIRFQNTGNDTAFKVIIKDTLPSQLDPLSIFTLGGSHPYKFKLEEKGIATWIFEPINLLDSFRNEALSNGFIRFTVSTKGILPVGTRIENRAGIYFDFNDVVLTPFVSTTIIKKIIRDTQSIKLCEGVKYKNIVYTKSIQIRDTISGNGVDTFRIVNIDVIPTSNTITTLILKKGETYNGTIYNEDAVFVKIYRSENGCDSIVTFKIMVNTTALIDLTDVFSYLNIYPNPTQNDMSIEFELKEAKTMTFNLYNALGQKVRILGYPKLYKSGKHVLDFDLKTIEKGIYFVQIETKNQFFQKQVVKM